MAVKELKIRLPGTITPVNLLAPIRSTGKEIIQGNPLVFSPNSSAIVDRFNIVDSAERQLVISPNPKTAGKIIQPDQIVLEEISSVGDSSVCSVSYYPKLALFTLVRS